MDYDKKFFQTAGELSETVALSALAALACRRDFKGLAAFMDFLKETNLPLMNIRENRVIPMSVPETRQGLNNHGVSTFVRHFGAIDLLMMPLMQTTDKNGVDAVNDLQSMSEDQLAHLDRVIELASTMKEHKLWRHVVLTSLAKSSNDPTVMERLPTEDFNVETKMATTSSNQLNNKSAVEVSVCMGAMLNGNLELAEAMYKRIPVSKTKTPPNAFAENLMAHGIESLAEGILKKPSAVYGLIDHFERTLPENVSDVRIKIFKRTMDMSMREKIPVESKDLMAIFDTQPDAIKNLQTWFESGVPDALALAKRIVSNHVVEALPLISKLAKIDPQSFRNGKLGIGEAINENSVVVNNADEENKLKTTLKFLMNHGHRLDDVALDAGALKVLAKNGSKEDVTRKLHVLLSLGADPKQKDERGYVPSSHVKQRMPDQKEPWLAVERSFQARKKSFTMLDQIEMELSVESAKAKP